MLNRNWRSFLTTLPAPYDKSKSLGSVVIVVEILKLKEIDGRAPLGVDTEA